MQLNITAAARHEVTEESKIGTSITRIEYASTQFKIGAYISQHWSIAWC